MAIKRMSVRNSAIVLTAANIVSQLFGFLYRILLGRLIGAEGMGLFQLIFPFYNLFLSLAATGLCVAVSRLSAEYLALQQYGAIKKLVSRALLTFFLLFILFSGLSLLFAEEIAVHFLGDERTLLAVYALIPVIFFTGIENLHKNFFYGTATVLPPAISDILEMTVRMSAVLLLLRLFLPVPDPKMLLLIVLGMLTCEIVSSLFLRTLYVRKTRGYAGRGAPDPNMKQKMRNIAVPISLSSFLNNSLGSLRIVLIPRRLEAAGYTHAAALTMFGELFGMTLPLLTLPTAFIHGLSLMILPKVTENLALRDYKALDRQISKTVLVTSWLILPSVALMVVAGPSIGSLLYNREISGQYMLPLAFGVALSIYAGIFGSMLNGLGRQTHSSVTALLGNGLELLIIHALTAVPGVGLYGYVIGLIISCALTAGIDLYFVVKEAKTEVKWASWFLLPLSFSVALALFVRLFV